MNLIKNRYIWWCIRKIFMKNLHSFHTSVFKCHIIWIPSLNIYTIPPNNKKATTNLADQNRPPSSLRTAHNRLNQHIYRVMKVISSTMYLCGEAEQNTEHFLQTCKLHLAQRQPTPRENCTEHWRIYRRPPDLLWRLALKCKGERQKKIPQCFGSTKR